MIKLLLTQPPSTNSLYFNSKSKRVKTNVYKAWQMLAMTEQKKQVPKIEMINGEFEVNLYIGKCNILRDLDNFEKATFDFLVARGFVKNDNLKYLVRKTSEKAFGLIPDGKILIILKRV